MLLQRFRTIAQEQLLMAFRLLDEFPLLCKWTR
jgi:hypothetical protein